MPMAGQLTRKQDRLVNAVVLGTAETVTEAGKVAGYSHLSTTSEALRSPKVQREIERRSREKSVSARAIRRRSLEGTAAELDNLRDPESLMRVAVMAATVEEKVGEADDEPADSPAEMRRRFHLIALRLARRCVRAAKVSDADAVTMAIDAQLVALCDVRLGTQTTR